MISSRTGVPSAVSSTNRNSPVSRSTSEKSSQRKVGVKLSTPCPFTGSMSTGCSGASFTSFTKKGSRLEKPLPTNGSAASARHAYCRFSVSALSGMTSVMAVPSETVAMNTRVVMVRSLDSS